MIPERAGHTGGKRAKEETAMPAPVTEAEYGELTRKASPGSPFLKNLALAYLSGGAICCLGQLLLGLYRSLGLPDVQARGFVSVTLIGLSAVLTALGLYDRLARRCGAGTLVPITGFANAVVSPAIEFRSEKLITGTCAKLFTIAGPVIAVGTAASVAYGLVLWVLGLSGAA